MLKFKKRLALIVFVIITLVLLLTFTSCDNSDTGTDASTETNSNINSDTNSNVDKEDEANTNTGTSDNTECEHILVVLTAVSPTCTQSGLSQGMKCSKCEKVITKQYEILPLNHDYIDHEAKEPTCTEIGWNEYQTCSRCDYSTYGEIEALGHKFVTYVSDGNATKESDGTKTSYCDNNGCNATDTITDVGSKLPIGYSDGLEYDLNVDGASYTLSGIGSCNDKNVIIPSEYNGYPVTTIGVRAFANKQIETIQIPETVETISEYAFQSSSLKEVRIPSSVKLIEGWAFSYCQNLKEVYISDTVISIIYTAFFEAEGIEKFVVDENNNFYSSYNDAIYSKDKKRIYHYPIGKTEPDVVIHSAVEFIEIACFNKCKNIETITMSNNVVQIGSLSFKNCIKLKSITLSNNIKEIEASVFENCVSLKTVGLPNGISLIYSDTFKGCSSLEAIYIPSTVSTISDINPFKGCVNLSTVYYEGSPEKWQSVANYNVSNELLAADFVYNSKMLCNHEIVIDEARAPTCALVGLTEGSHCKWCNLIVEEQEKIEKIKHIEEILPSIEPTCTETGLTEGKKCSVCGEILIEQETIEATSVHKFENDYTCIVCKKEIYKASDGLRYSLSLNKTYYMVSGIGTCYSANIVVPYTYNGLPVKGIKNDAFYGCTSLTSVVIPNSVIKIEFNAFYGCTSLTSITIPDTVTSIGSYAFKDCISLSSIKIPNSVIEIDYGAFYGCTSLTNIEISENVETIGDIAFEKCTSLIYNEYDNAYYLGNEKSPYLVLVKVKNTNITSCQIYQNTKFIHSDAFNGCVSLTNITIPNSIIGIGESAFYNCASLTEILIPDGITKVEDTTFCGCTSLESVIIPDSVTSIGSNAFKSCAVLKSITIPDSVTDIGSFAFRNCTSLTSIVIPKNVLTIGLEALSGCKSLINIIVDENNTAYKSVDGDLYTKDGLTLIQYAIGKTDIMFEIPQDVTSIGNYAFYGCDSLESIIIGGNITKIGWSSFAYCKALASVAIGDSVEEIGEGAFQGCIALKHVTIQEGLNLIGGLAFKACTSLENIIIPSSITTIKSETFYGCTSLTSVEIPDSVTTIGSYAFYGCTSLTIYCEAKYKPNDWSSSWNYSNRPVYWYSETEPTTEGNYWHYGTNGEIVAWE